MYTIFEGNILLCATSPKRFLWGSEYPFNQII